MAQDEGEKPDEEGRMSRREFLRRFVPVGALAFTSGVLAGTFTKPAAL
jgi:hypothetical protein